MKHPENLTVSIYRTSLSSVRMVFLWLGISLIATGADATTIQSSVKKLTPTHEAGTKTTRAKPSATARARARAARIRAARARASRAAKALAEARTPRYRTDEAGNV